LEYFRSTHILLLLHQSKYLIYNLAINKDGDTSFLTDLLQTFFDIPDNFVQIKRTVTDALDEVAYLLSDKQNLLFSAFTYLIKSLDNEIISSKLNIT
jgi:hypothetical protein